MEIYVELKTESGSLHLVEINNDQAILVKKRAPFKGQREYLCGGLDLYDVRQEGDQYVSEVRWLSPVMLGG